MGSVGEQLDSAIEQLQQAQRRSKEIEVERRDADRAELDAEDEGAVDRRVAALIALEKEALAVAARIVELTYKVRLLGNARLPVHSAARRAQQAENAAELRRLDLDHEAASKQLEAAQEEVNAAANRVVQARADIERAASRGVDLLLNRRQKHVTISSASPLHPPEGVLVRFSDWFDLITEARSSSAAWLLVAFDESENAIELLDARSVEGSRLPGLIEWWGRKRKGAAA